MLNEPYDSKPIIRALKRDHKPLFKQKLQYWITLGAFDGSKELATNATNFINSDYAYFSDTSFFETELGDINSLCTESWIELNNYIARDFKQILEKQLQYI